MVPTITRITPKPYNIILLIVDLAMSVTRKTHILPRTALISILFLSILAAHSSVSFFQPYHFPSSSSFLSALSSSVTSPSSCARPPLPSVISFPPYLASGVQRPPASSPLVVFSSNKGDVLQLRSAQLSLNVI